MRIRYQRNPWDKKFQKKLGNTKVAIVGDGLLFDYMSAALAALGIGDGAKGDITLFEADSGDLGFLTKLSENGTRLDTLKKINPYVAFYKKKFKFDKESDGDDEITIYDPDIIISTIACKDEDRRKYLEYLLSCIRKNNDDSEHKIHLLHLEANSYKGLIHSPKNEDKLEFLLEQGPQNPSVCCAISAAATEAVIRLVKHGNLIVPPKVIYDLSSETLNESDNKFGVLPFDYSKYNALIVGAGAMGNFVGMNAVLHGFKSVTILDFDDIEETNLNRQILLYGEINKQKADILKQRLLKLNPNVTVNSVNLQVCIEKESEFEKIVKENNIDLIFGCIDLVRPRLFLTQFAAKQKDKAIPYIDGGCKVDGGGAIYIDGGDTRLSLPISNGNVRIYVPGVSKCIKHYYDLSRLLTPGETEITEGCNINPEPSVITGNMASAGLLTGEVPYVIAGKFRQSITYDTKYGNNWFSGKPDLEACECHAKEPNYLHLLSLPQEKRNRYGR